MKRTKALLLFSGGLDSMLAAKILEEQRIGVTALIFKSCFFDSAKAEKSAEQLKLKHRTIDISKAHLGMLKSPLFGYGKGMNPCIDCRILMLKKAKEIMRKEKYGFVATGEVLGQRPMSQNREAMQTIEKESCLEGFLLRPLSAKLLEKTIPEKSGQVEREKLLMICGKSRKKQIELTEKYQIKQYPNPAGGCLLTDPEFSKRMKIINSFCKEFSESDVFLAKIGRHFCKGKCLIVVGRNKEENSLLRKTAEKGDVLVEMKKYKGPMTLVRQYGKNDPLIEKTAVEEAERLTKYYSLKARNEKNVEFRIKSAGTRFFPF